MKVNFKKQAEFPLLETYKKAFPVDDRTIFAYKDTIYCDYELPNHLVIHEITHLNQQERDGLEFWVNNYLKDPEYRLRQEVEAYRNQIMSIKDSRGRALTLMNSAQALSSGLYGDLVSYAKAMHLLKVR